jgi:hypothetical protein
MAVTEGSHQGQVKRISCAQPEGELSYLEDVLGMWEAGHGGSKFQTSFGQSFHSVFVYPVVLMGTGGHEVSKPTMSSLRAHCPVLFHSLYFSHCRCAKGKSLACNLRTQQMPVEP